MPPSERRKKITIQAGQICPLCREKVHIQEVLSVCPGCRAVYHRECSGELASGRCTTLGCRYSRRRTASGRRPSAPVHSEPARPPRTQPHSLSERVLRGAMACGVTLAFLCLAIYAAGAIEANAIKSERARRRAARADHVSSVLEAYRPLTFKLQALARRGHPPANWRFPRGPFRVNDAERAPRPDTAVITWKQLQDPSADSPLDLYFPKGFRHGLHFSTMPSSHRDFPRTLDRRIERAQSVHRIVVVRVESLQPAEPLSSDPSRRPKKSNSNEWAVEFHSQAQIVLRAYLYDLDAEPSYEGCLEVSGRSPETPSSLYIDPLTGMPLLADSSTTRRDNLLLTELVRNGIRFGSVPRADAAALSAAYQELARELREIR